MKTEDQKSIELSRLVSHASNAHNSMLGRRRAMDMIKEQQQHIANTIGRELATHEGYYIGSLIEIKEQAEKLIAMGVSEQELAAWVDADLLRHAMMESYQSLSQKLLQASNQATGNSLTGTVIEKATVDQATILKMAPGLDRLKEAMAGLDTTKSMATDK